MTIQEYRDRTKVERIGTCQYRVTITYYGKKYTCMSNNSTAWDRLDDDRYPDNYRIGFHTNKEAWRAFYEECKRGNHLGDYKY